MIDKLFLNCNQVFTHRGLEPSKENFYPESSIEAFSDQLNRGFGLEFDPNFVKDGIVVNHDATLKRITNGTDTRDFHDITVAEATGIQYGTIKGRMPTFDELMELIGNSGSKINALHLKGKFQTKEYLDRLADSLYKYENLWDRIVIFDAKPETAKYLQEKGLKTHYAPSVAHPFDIERYNGAVSGTLISVEDAVKYKQQGLYDWVWLDEWDRTEKDGKDKTLYNKEIFEQLKNVGYKISLVTPELHGTSPGLLGGEAHPDAKDKNTLFARIQEIIALEPDAICTDYPEDVIQPL
jgi:Glycerophosphoryl diester phosphodiesterase family